jgi:hypothetical protein
MARRNNRDEPVKGACAIPETGPPGSEGLAQRVPTASMGPIRNAVVENRPIPHFDLLLFTAEDSARRHCGKENVCFPGTGFFSDSLEKYNHRTRMSQNGTFHNA